MSLAFGDLNWLAVIVAGTAGNLVNAIWYTPLMFGKIWGSAVGWSDEQIKDYKVGPSLTRFTGLIATIVSAIALGLVFAGLSVTQFGDAIIWALVISIGFYVTIELSSNMFARRKFSLTIVNGLARMVTVIVVAIILAVWQ